MRSKRQYELQPERSFDQIFDDLISLASAYKSFVITDIWKYGSALQVCRVFLDRYRMFIKSAKLTTRNGAGQLHIRLKRTIPEKSDRSYSEIEQDYTQEYYLTDCGGYVCFTGSNGQVRGRT